MTTWAELSGFPEHPIVTHDFGHEVALKHVRGRIAALCATTFNDVWTLHRADTRFVSFRTSTSEGIESITIKLGQPGEGAALRGLHVVHRRGQKDIFKMVDTSRETGDSPTLRGRDTIVPYYAMFLEWLHLVGYAVDETGHSSTISDEEHTILRDARGEQERALDNAARYISAGLSNSEYPATMGFSGHSPTVHAPGWISTSARGPAPITNSFDMKMLDKDILLGLGLSPAWYVTKGQRGYYRIEPQFVQRDGITAAGIVETMKALNDPLFSNLSWGRYADPIEAAV